MRPLTASAALLALLPLLGAAREPPAEKRDYQEFSKLVHAILVKQAPREFEDRSGWGGSIPFPEKLRLPGIPRTTVRVGDHDELAHGAWRRFKGRIDDPKRDLTVRVRDFRRLDDGTYRLVMDGEAVVACEGEWQQWLKGILLVGATAQADATLSASVVCDVKVAVKLKSFPPELAVEPAVKELEVDVKDFAFRRAPGVSDPERTKLEARLRDVLGGALKLYEPLLKEQANEAIARALREGKGTISAATLFRLQKAPAKESK